MKYEFGVMSTKYFIEAKNDFIAHISMAIFIGKPIPIAIYEPRKYAINPKEILDTDNKLNADQIQDITEAMKTIQKMGRIGGEE